MQKRSPVLDLQTQRGENYAVHFASRQQVKALPEETLIRLRNVAEVVRSPRLSLYGHDDYTEDEWKQIILLANQAEVPAWLCVAWYLSDTAWDNFQVHWRNLPEPYPEKFSVAYEVVSRPVEK